MSSKISALRELKQKKDEKDDETEKKEANIEIYPIARQNVTKQFNLGEQSSLEIMCVRFDPDGNFVAATCSDGTIKVYNCNSGKMIFNLGCMNTSQQPTTCVRWRPHSDSNTSRNVLISVSADGCVSHWHATSGKCLHTIKSTDNQLFCMDYTHDATQFATAGKDRIVRVYDEKTKTVISEMEEGQKDAPGHTNRIFSLIQNQYDDMIVTGGWDNTVQIWDVRIGKSVRSIFGPHLCGDAIDIADDQILTGSYRLDDVLQIQDFGTGKLMETISWDGTNNFRSSVLLYSLQFIKNEDHDIFCAGGAGNNEVKMFDRMQHNKPFMSINDLSSGCYSIDFNSQSNRFAMGCGDGLIRIYGIQKYNY